MVVRDAYRTVIRVYELVIVSVHNHTHKEDYFEKRNKEEGRPRNIVQEQDVLTTGVKIEQNEETIACESCGKEGGPQLEVIFGTCEGIS